MAGKLVKRTLDIIKSGVDEKVKDYTSNWTQFTSDAREVKDILIKGETNAADTVQKLKRTGITKKISDWFYGAETEFESSGSDSDFDPGFSVESSSDGKLDGDKSSSALTYDSMKDLSAKQTGMMVKIGRRQTEQSVANTAEVISTINNRTAEMVAVMNNINTSLKGVNDRLDKLIKIQSLGIEAEEERALGGEGGLYDSNGMLSLKGVFDAARTTGSGKFGQALQALGMAKGNIGPEMLFGLALDSVLGRQRSSLGGKSVNELGKEFNEFIGNGIQTALTNVITGKAFKSLFGDITGFEADKNYGDLRNARYDTKRAQFDNMTRHSIVKIMPELLIKLNENLSGKSYHINQNGDIVEGPAKNYFREAVSGAVGSVNITSRAYSNINQGMKQVFNKEIPKEDIDAAADALLRYYVDYGHRKGSIITKDDIRNASPEAIGTVCDIIGMTNTDSSKGYNYWSKVCQTILYKVTNGNSFDAHAFVNSINQSIRNTQSAAAEQARGFYGDQAGKITLDILKSGYVEKYGSEAQRNQISRSTTTTASKFTTADYVKGIFALLNRGINVKLEGKGTYRKLTEADVKKEPWVIQSTNDEAAARLFGALTGDKNAIKGSMESALGLLGTANNATGGKVGVLQTAANLTTMFNQGKGFFDNIRNKQLTQNLVAAIHGDASALQAQVYDKLDQAKGVIIRNAPGMAYDQRVQSAGRSIQGIGQNAATHATNFIHNLKNKFMGSNIGQNAYRNVNNAIYANDTRKLNAAQAAIDNFNFHDLSQDDLKVLAEYQQAMDAKEFEKAYRLKQGLSSSGSEIIGNLSEDEKKASQNAFRHLSHQYDTINSINARRTNVQGNPDIGAVRMAAPDKASKEHSKMYNLVKGGFNITAKALGAIAKIVRSGLEDVYYGFGSAIQGMFGGPRRNQQTGKMELHRGLIGDLTWGTMKTGAHYTKMALGAAGKLVGKVGGAIGTATQGIRDKWNAGDSGIYDSELDRNLTRAELNERRRDEIVSQNYEHRDKDGKWHFRAQRDENGNKVVKQGSTVTRGDFADAPLKSLGKTVMNVVGKLGAFGKGIVEVTKKLGGMIAKPFKFAADLFKKSSFGKGFFEGFGKAKEARNARKLEKERNSSFANSAIGTVMDVLTGKTKDGPLERICDILKVIETNTNPNKPTTDPNATGEGTNTNETQNGGTGEDNVDTKGENKENKDDSSDKGEGESGGEEKKKGRWASFKESASEKVGGAVNKFKGTEAGKLVTGTLENMGKVVGGMAQGVMGILKIAVGVLTAMEGFKAIQTLVEDIFKKGLKPLNQVFQKVYHMIKPLATQLTNIVKEIAKALTQMLDGVLKTLTPLLKMISDAISTIFETVLQPVMEILDATLSACMVPITLCLDAMKPALDIICNDLKIVSGVVQMGMGGIMGLLGGIGKGIGFLVSGVGHILKKFSRKAGSRLVETGNDVSDAADDMLGNAKTLMVNGAKQFKEGLEGQLTVVKKLVTLEYLDNEEEEKKETVVDEERASKINLSDAGANFGSGDINNYNTWNYTYGSGNTMNQHTYGPTMNMAERGCGPVALADAYMRRTGSGMSPLTLAGAMMGNGSYEPNRGTSVASMVNTGRSLGMNMQVGGVTQRSLNGASPSNPITIMGSGSGFGTKRGNDHYLNVVGSDGRGNSYVSNPLNGRVSKTPTSQLALNSRLGLYGSGDKLPDEFGIDLDSMTALERLQSLSERFQKIFTGDSTVDKTKKDIEAGKNENMANLLEAQLGNLTEEQQKAILETARKAYDENGGFRAKRDGETEEEYQAARDKDFEKNKQRYINYAMNQLNIENASNSLEDNTKLGEGFESNWDKMNKNYNKAKETLGDNSLSDDISSESDTTGGSGVSSWQGAEMFPFSPLKHKDVNITSDTSNESPVHDFFASKIISAVRSEDSGYDDRFVTMDGGWYKHGSKPNSSGEGSSGNPNEGVVFTYGVDPTLNGFEGTVYPITGGTVVYVSKDGKSGGSDPNGGYGNSVKWRDAAGMYHWYMGLDSIYKDIAVGNDIERGVPIGTMGTTGILGGTFLSRLRQYNDPHSPNYHDRGYLGQWMRYIVTKTGGNQVGDEVNPLTYWKYEESDSSSASMTGNSNAEKIYTYFKSLGMSDEGIAGILGYSNGESSLIPNNLNNDAQAGLGYAFGESGDEQYTNEVDNGSKTRDEFVNDVRWIPSHNCNSPYGYGVFQFSMGDNQGFKGNKALLYDATVGAGSKKSISDLKAQLDIQTDILKNQTNYNGMSVWDALKQVTTPEQAVRIFAARVMAGTGYDPSGDFPHLQASISDANSFYSQFKNYTGQSNPADIEVNGNDKNFRFISTARNSAGDATDLIKAVASAFKAYVDTNSDGTYMNANYGKVVAPDGYVWESFRPDCSGFMSAGMKKLGYTFSGSNNDTTGPLTFDFLAHPAIPGMATNGTAIFRGNGGPGDWILMDADESILEPGDILIGNAPATNGHTADGHMAMYLSKNKGLDGGHEGIKKSAAAYEDVMAGKYDSNKLPYTMPFHDSNWLSTPQKLLRYVGGLKTDDDTNGAPTLSSASSFNLKTGNELVKEKEKQEAELLEYIQNAVVEDSKTNIKKSSLYEGGTADTRAAMARLLKDSRINKQAVEYLYLAERAGKRDINYDAYIGDPNGKNDYDPSGATWEYLPNTTIGVTTEKYYINKIMEEIRNMHSNEYMDPQTIHISTSGDSYYDNLTNINKFNKVQKSSMAMFDRRGDNEWAWSTGGMGDVSPEVPAVDMNKLFDETSQTMQNATNAFTGGTTVVVTRDDQSTADMITRLSEITFKVRNERVEELLEELVDYVKTTKKKSSTFNHVHGSNNYTIEDMFDDEIPEGVVRLSKGG